MRLSHLHTLHYSKLCSQRRGRRLKTWLSVYYQIQQDKNKVVFLTEKGILWRPDNPIDFHVNFWWGQIILNEASWSECASAADVFSLWEARCYQNMTIGIFKWHIFGLLSWLCTKLFLYFRFLKQALIKWWNFVHVNHNLGVSKRKWPQTHIIKAD